MTTRPDNERGRPGGTASDISTAIKTESILRPWTPAHTCNTCPHAHDCRCTPSTLERVRPARPAPCDWCGAPAGERCYRVAPGRRMVRLEAGFHPSRLEAVAA